MGANARKPPEACTSTLESAGAILKRTRPDLVVSKYRLRQADGISLVLSNREAGTQRLAFSSRPFVLCGLPVRRPPAGQLLYERQRALRIAANRSSRVRAAVWAGPFGADSALNDGGSAEKPDHTFSLRC